MTGWTDKDVERAARAMQGFNSISALRDIPWETLDEKERSAWLAMAKAALIPLPSPSAARDALEERLWGIIDRDGLRDVPSDIVEAVSRLVMRASAARDKALVRMAGELAPELDKLIEDSLNIGDPEDRDRLVKLLWDNQALILRVVQDVASSPPAPDGAPDMLAALKEAEACMSIVEPRSDKAEYLRILGVVRKAIAGASDLGRSQLSAPRTTWPTHCCHGKTLAEHCCECATTESHSAELAAMRKVVEAAEGEDDAREVTRGGDRMTVNKSWWIALQGALDVLAALTPEEG